MKYSVNKRKRRIWRVGQILAVGHLQLKSGMSATLSAPFTGPYHADGNLFTLETKSTQLSIRGFDINLDAGATTIEVYSRPGVIVTNNNDNGWFLVQTAHINGQGKGLATSLPDFTFPVSIPANSKQSFYVTSSDGAKDVWYDLGQNLGQPYAADEYLSVLEGYALAYSFVASSGPRRWNGNVRYTFSGEASQLPTVKPTVKPTLASTIPPSPKVCQYPTAYPTLNAMITKEPTSNPTTRPTLKPNTTPKPMAIPPVFEPRIGIKEPTQSPSAYAPLSPSDSPTKSLSAKNPSNAPTPHTSSSSSIHNFWSGVLIALWTTMLWSTIYSI